MSYDISLEQLYEIVEAAVVRPGDTLVISFAGPMSMEQFDRAHDRAKAFVGDAIKLLLIGDAIGLHVLRHEDAVLPGGAA